ncbi:Progestin and adipoQ receptor member [Chamberlinius hualienensis]
MLTDKMLSLNDFVSSLSSATTLRQRFQPPNQPPLLTVDQVPPGYREPSIITGYRPYISTPSECMASVFNATNETLNFWTHFIPTFYFVWKLFDIFDILNVTNDCYTWSFLIYMITICFYPFISCTAHAFSSISHKVRHICYFLDYGALSIYGYGAGILYAAYVLPANLMNSSFREFFMYGNVLCAILCTLSACSSRFVHSKLAIKVLRLGAFALPFVWVNIPLAYRLISCYLSSSSSLTYDCSSLAVGHHSRQFMVALLGAFVYAFHVPECLAPGKFDIIGHSHQWLHICGILATLEQMNGSLIDLMERKPLILEMNMLLPISLIFNSSFLILISNAAIILMFSTVVINKVKDD